MYRITANLSGKARKETRNGRVFLVAPMTLLREQVLAGSAGPLYYPGEEIEASADAWNGMPIINRHPVDGSGKLTTARSAKAWHDAVIGNVFGVAYQKAKKRLRGEGWFDEDLTRQIEPRVHAALLAGGKVELSAGFTSVSMEPAPEGAVFNGKAYSHTARKYVPDHVAVLPDETGACSVADGCGVNNAGKKRKAMPKLLWQLARLLRLVKDVEEPPPAQTSADVTAVANEMSHDQLRQAISQALRSRFTQDEPGCWIYEVFDGYFVYEQAGKLWRLDYARSDQGVTLSGEPAEVVREINYVAAGDGREADAEGMAMNKAETITWLVANCDCWKDGKAELEKLSDAQLARLKSGAEKHAEAVANAARQTADTPLPLGKAEWDQMVANVAALVESGRRRDEREAAQAADAKKALVDALVANVADEAERQRRAAVYGGMGHDALVMLLADRGVQHLPQQAASYLGAAGSVVNAGKPPRDDSQNLLPAGDCDPIEFASPRLRPRAAAQA